MTYRPRILLVDDDPQIRAFMSDLLGPTHEVLAVDGGEAALEVLSERAFDLVISDLRMPGMSGLQLIERLTDRPLDVIVMTGNADVDSAVSAIKHGAYDFVRKPFNIDEILHAIERVTQKQRLEREARQYRDHLEALVDQRTAEYRDAVLAALNSLVHALELRDPYTKDHSDNVARFSVALAEAAGLDAPTRARVATAGLLHDLGKIGIPDAVLSKPGKLTDAEFAQIRHHPVAGYDVLARVIDDPQILGAVRHHHERWDGSGYPDRLPGATTPLFARVLAVADAYDAMTSDRSYRPAMTTAAARVEIQSGAGSQFDPDLAAAFLALDLDAIRTAPVPEPHLADV